MPDGIDNGVRYAALYEQKGLDPTEIEANKQLLANAKESVEEMISNEVQKELETVQVSKSDSNANEAGLNPLSMNGTNGAGEVVDTTPPEDMGNLAALTQVFNMF
ncbi:unnamed protein product [Cylicocyclus nassatus]|uniref:Uncharacterized protein n=1 Tax=Cylicocyclus nassatus TaxID=53992 RepID=A0AA36GYM9_CYLNA|nr:unnamed protein product [Cylicocyclus nassatus]